MILNIKGNLYINVVIFVFNLEKYLKQTLLYVKLKDFLRAAYDFNL